MPHTNLHRSNQGTSIPFRPDIEGLRALAVCLVIASHAGVPFLRAGFVGVDVFFVLSGYLITSLLMKEITSSGTVNFSRFYARRARRLLPAAITMVLVVCCAESIIMSPLAQFKTLKAACATVLYSSNFYFAHVQQQYFYQRSAASNPLLHTWSLAVEEQFYLIWPVLLLLLARMTRSVKGRSLTLAIISLASFALCIWLTATNSVLAFYATPVRVWEFGVGGLLAFMPEHWLLAHRRLCSWLGGIGILTLTASAVWIHASIFPGYIAAIPVAATLLLLLAGVGAPQSPAIRLLCTTPAQITGRLSYSLYLWHWPVLVIGQQLVPNNSVAMRLGWIALACLLAAVTYAVIENPIRRQPFLVARSGLTLQLALLSAIICIGAMLAWRSTLHRSEQFRKYDRAVQDIPELYRRKGCAPARPDPHPTMCFFGDVTNPQSTVVLFGDSHAAEWFPALQQIADAHHWRLATLVKPGCTPLNMKVDPQMYPICEQWRRTAMAEIEALHPDLVIVTSASRAVDANGKFVADIPIWEQGARDTFTALATQRMKVRFIRDSPFADYDVPDCLAQAEWDRRTQCPPSAPATALSPAVYAAEQRGAQGLGNVKFIDLSDQMCNPDRCSLEVGGQPIYRDGDHLTASFSRTLSAVLFQRLKDSEP